MTTKPDDKGCQARNLKDGWLVSTPHAQGMVTKSPESLIDQFSHWYGAIVQAVLMARNGKDRA